MKLINKIIGVAMILMASLTLVGNDFAEAQTPSYAVGGNIFGLGSEKSVVLLLNASNPLTLKSNGSFSFPTALKSGAGYSVTIAIQPKGQICTVANGSGTNISDDVMNIGVSCSNSYTISGPVSGLNASGLVLRMNSVNLIIPNGATSFKFATTLTTGAFYSVSIGIQPIGQTCSVSGGLGVVGGVNPVGIGITCINSYTVGGLITGLATTGLVVQLNGGARKIIPSNATSFSFSTGLVAGANYMITVSGQPESQTCLVLNPSGTIVSSNINGVVVSCTPVPLIWDNAGQWNYATWN